MFCGRLIAMLIILALTRSGSSGMEIAGKIIIPNNQTSISELIIMYARIKEGEK